MAENGIKTTNLAALPRFDSLVGNSDGSTALIPFVDAARQMAGLGINGLDEWLLAQKWAENAEDDPVAPGQFSALHHAAKAADSALAAADDLLLVQGARDDAIELINITGPVQVVETIADRDALTGLSADDVVEVLAERARYVWDGAAFGAAYSLSPASEAATMQEISDDILATEAAIAAAQVHKLTKDTGLGLDTGSAQISGLTDLDTLFRAGVYAFSSASVTNLPPSGADPGFIVTVTGYDENSIRQSATNIRDNNLWHRWYQGVWSDWEAVGAPFANQAEAEAGTNNTKLMTALRTSQAIAAQAPSWTELAPVATTSGTAIDVTSIPAGVTDIEVWLDGVSGNSTGDLLLQLGTGGSITETGYVSASSIAGTSRSSTIGMINYLNGAGNVLYGNYKLKRFSGNIWTSETIGTTQNLGFSGGGRVALAGELDILRLALIAGSFDAGEMRLRYM